MTTKMTEEYKALSEEMMKLFQGYCGAYGTYHIYDASGIKKAGKGVTVKDPVTIELWQGHIAGTFNSGLGIVPINEDEMCYWGCIDIDSYQDFSVEDFAREVRESPLVVCRSKSGGAHCFLFAKEPLPAALMQQKLRELAAAYGYSGCEIFPKQVRRTSDNDIGNWLNMPYFDAENTLRYCIDCYGNRLSLAQFIEYAREKMLDNAGTAEKVTAKMELDEEFDVLFQEGPPCHEALYKRGIRATEDGRNNCLWSIAQQFKRQRPEDWEDLLLAFNKKHCSPSLSTSEVKNIINSAKKEEGFYKCNDKACSQNCDKVLCRQRKFGVGSTTVAMPKFVSLQKTGGQKDCLWYMTLDTSETIELSTEELFSPAKVRIRLAESLASPILLPEIKAENWRKILAELFDNACEVVDGEGDASTDVFYDLLDEFLFNRRTSSAISDISFGRVVETEEGCFFKIKDFVKFLADKKYTRLTVQQIASKLKSKPVLTTDSNGRKIYKPQEFCSYRPNIKIKVRGEWRTERVWFVPVHSPNVDIPAELPPALQGSSPFDFEEDDE